MQGACCFSSPAPSSGPPLAGLLQLPEDVLRMVLLLSGMPCTRQVCRAARDAFDAVNPRLHVSTTSAHVVQRQPWQHYAARQSVVRVIQRSPSLTSVTLHQSSCLSLPEVLSAGKATDLAGRLRELRGLCIVQTDTMLHQLQQCTGLQHLEVRGRIQHLSNKQQAVQALCDALKHLPSLTYLSALGCLADATSVTESAFSEALATLTQLQHLHLAENKLETAGMKKLGPALLAMPRLQTLNVSSNLCRQLECSEALCAALLNAPGLTHLDVSWNELGAEGVAILAPALRRMAKLQQLQLQHNMLGDAGMVAIAPTLAQLPLLQTLNLSSNQLGAAAMAALQPVLASQGGPLQTLNLSCNDLRQAAAAALAAALRSASGLQGLNLMGTRLGPDEVAALAPAIGNLAPTLRSLQLADNSDLGLAGAAALASALQSLTGLTSLDLSRRLGPDGVAAIAPALQGMRGLRNLVLEGCNLTSDAIAALTEALPTLPGLLQRLQPDRRGSRSHHVADSLAPAVVAARSGLTDLCSADDAALFD